MRRVISTVTNDLISDQRAHKTATSLLNNNYQVTLIGRRFSRSQNLAPRAYETRRIRLLFNKGPLFYLEYNLRLFFILLSCKADVLLANDLDTLSGVYLASKIRGIALVFDSHEYYTEVPELVNRPLKKKIWKKTEQWIVPKLNRAYTVCESIAQLYEQEYGTSFKVVRNIPLMSDIEESEKPSIPVIIYQGAINVGRGIEHAVQAMQYIDDAEFWIVGDGDILQDVRNLVFELKLDNKVKLLGRVPFEELRALTSKASIGLSIEENIGLNYYYALPNKLFDYVHAHVPILGSDLPEIKNIVAGSEIGEVLKSHEPKQMAEQLIGMLNNKSLRDRWTANLKIASKELTWENEEKILLQIFDRIEPKLLPE